MKSILSIALLIVSAGCVNSQTEAKDPDPIEIGKEAPMQDYKMKGVDSEQYSLESLKEENGLLVIFSCNTCPFVLGWEETYPGLAANAAEKGIGMVLVNSNEVKRDGDDSMEEMMAKAKEGNYQCPYVVDEKSQLANAFGAKTTPHVFLFDADMKLVYSGSINNKFEKKSKKADAFYLRNALESLYNGEEIETPRTREIGCSIKRTKA